MSPRLAWAAVALAASVAAPLGAQPLGTEFRVNGYTTGNQTDVSVATAPSGDFVIVWSGPGSSDDSGIYARRFSAAGEALGAEFRVNTYTTGTQQEPRVAVDQLGGFVVVWESAGQDGNGAGVFGQRYAPSGAPAGGEFRANFSAFGDELSPAVASDATGNLIVVWEGNVGSDFDGGIVGRRISSTGALLASDFQINGFTSGLQSRPAVASATNGDFVVVWDGLGSLEASGVFGRRFRNDGGAQDIDFRVNATTAGGQGFPSVACDAAGNFVVVFRSDGTSGGPLGVYGRRYTKSGAPLGAEFRVDGFTTVAPFHTAVSMDLAGGFVVSWTNSGQDGSGYGVFARRYDADGKPLGGEFRVTTATTDAQNSPSIGKDSSGGFVVAWLSRLQDGSERGIFAQRFHDAGTFADANGDGAVSVSDVFYLINFLFAGGAPPP